MSARLLFFDIETAPAKVYTFQLYQPIIGMDQIIEPSRIIAWSASWGNGKRVHFMSEFHDGQLEMLTGLHALWQQCDVIVTYNGKRFDEPWVRGEVMKAGLSPLKPIRHLDLFQISKQNMKNLSGKLDYLALTLLNDRKVSHEGFMLWKKCLEGDASAWARMKRYAIKDTALMPPLYDIIAPYMKGGINQGLYGGNPNGCPHCESEDIQKRGFAYTGIGKYQQFQCQNPSCGKWFKDSHLIETVNFRAL